MSAAMAQYHRIPRNEQRTPDVANRIETALQWGAIHWKALAAGVVVMLFIVGGLAWFQQQRQEQAATASLLASQAKDDAALQERLVQDHGDTLAGQNMRLTLARRALEQGDFAKAREWLTPLTKHAAFPLLRAAAFMWTAAAFEGERAWDDAARAYRRVLALHGAGIDHDRALQGLVRVLQHAGKMDEVNTALRASSLTSTKEIEELWLVIDQASAPSSH